MHVPEYVQEEALVPKALHPFGFCLVELAIVMLIAGILRAGLTMPINARRDLYP